ncbi:Retrovirus-related Pol polyprotein from type-1 retrotransposable element R1 [Araneus ventricosus]|uniref:Retrovirus-related Pol polyprotein from type-1 retrotransposable element R1 n=1 Tax=Araneus ventricosus TaxID=182803 RepID=A0A4Y2L2D8_ARAVE|nr:Retrovirus-related Pol polyprotein from type-1 retrotransposable element R1 [Araneus ventricosus]
MAGSEDFTVQAQRVHEAGLELLDSASKSNKISQVNQNNFRKIFMDFVEVINKHQKLLNIVTGRMLEQKELIQTKLEKLTLPPTSFAEIVKEETRKHRSRSRPRDKKNTVLVYSKNETDSKKIRDKVHKAIDPFKLKISIKNVKDVKKGILIECNKEDEIQRLTDEIEGNEILKNECEIRQPQKFNPKVITYRDGENFDIKEGLSKLKEQNAELEEAEVTHEFLQKTKFGTNWIISIDPKSFFKIMKIGKINCGWQKHNIREYLKVKQCYKCYKFGHLAKFCKNITDDRILCSSICGCPRGFWQIAVDGEPRVAVFIRDTFKFVILEKERDIIALMLNWNNFEYLIVNIYCPPSVNIESSIERLETICTRFLDKRVIVFGDFNAKSSAWSPRPTDERGRLVLEFVNKLDFLIENSCDSIATYSCEKGESWIDLVISKNIDRTLFSNWQVHNQITASDHRLITYTLSETPRQVKRRSVWKLENLKILEFKLEMNKLVSHFSRIDLNKDNLEEMLSKFCSRLVKICIKCRKNRGFVKMNNAVWWTQNLETERSRIRALRRRFQACLEQTERIRRRITFKKEFSKYKKLILSAKTFSFRGFLEKLVNKNNLGLVKDVLKLGNIELRIEKIRLASGVYIENFEECRNHILKFHFPMAQVEDTADLGLCADEAYPEFSLDEVEMCINKMKRDKAPGEDGFSLSIIEEIFYADSGWFVKIFNLCLKFGIFPKIWKEPRVVLIPKSNKDLSNSESYRPICLLSVWGKILYKLMTQRLVYFLESNNLLDHRQYGFREGIGTLAALKAVNKFIDCAKNENLVTCLISLDIKNAFNSIRWKDIINLLKLYKISGKLLKLFRSFLNDRTVFLEDGSKWNYNIGVPQGSSCGPILWLIVANEAY